MKYVLQKYNELKGSRLTLNSEHLEGEVILSESYSYVKIESVGGIANYNIAVYINDASEDDYIVFSQSLILEDIEIKKIKVKLVDSAFGENVIQFTLMR